MPLQEVKIAPGFNKQVTPTGAAGRWVDGDNVRFRYSFPEKIGGWEQVTSKKVIGAARDMHIWGDLDGRRYIAYGTNKGLFVYYEGEIYDISPLETEQTSATMSSTNGSTSLIINKNSHNLQVNDLLIFNQSSFPGGGATSFTTTDFDSKIYEVTTVPNRNQFTVTTASAETGTGMSAQGSIDFEPYIKVGGIRQVSGFGFGTGTWGGTIVTDETTLNGALLNDSNGTGGSGTSITLTDATAFPTSGTILVENELITYTAKSSNDLQNITRGALGSATAAHANGTTVKNASEFVAWGETTGVVQFTLDPGNWSLDNFGQTLVATAHNGRTFSWNPIAADTNALTTRSTVISGAPTKSVMSVVSERDRHLVILGTNTTIADDSTFDRMFIRFSDQESLSTYAPTSTNTAGTFRLDSGNKIVGAAKAKDYILILTDTAAYRMQFVGPPFTFSITQVGSNCGAISQHSMVYVDGAVFWMAKAGGFFVYDGTVKKLPCQVEDFVFTTLDDGDLGIEQDSTDLVYAHYNSLFGEINWFYPKNGSQQIDRVVTYNYLEGVWTTGSLARTTYYDKTLYPNPYATSFNPTEVPNFPVIQGVTNANGATLLYAHEKGTDEVDDIGGITPVLANIRSGDFEIPLEGNLGQVFAKLRRFIPDFRALQGNAQVTIRLRDFPSDTAVSSTLGPFTISSSTKKIDTRSRARALNFILENTSSGESWRFGTFRADIQLDGQR